jgi:Zn-dependent protease with chaperone function
MKKIFNRYLLSPIFAATLLTGCASTTAPGTVGIERKQMLIISSQDMNKASEQAYRSTLKQAGDKGKLQLSGPSVDRVRAIVRRLIPATAVFRPDAPKWKWEANVIESPELNAWCMPGGKVAVYTGLIEKLHATDDELAAVMGHEIAHALREHGRERASRSQMTNLGLSVIGIATGIGQVATDLER